MRLQHIIGDIQDERARQDKQWGGANHDATHTFDEWIALIAKAAGKAACETDPHLFRRQMIKVAALAVAALEAQP